jgi:hypothetical protein
MENNFAECVIEKHKAMEDLAQCDESVNKLQSSYQQQLLNVGMMNDHNQSSFHSLDMNSREYNLPNGISSITNNKWLVVGIPTMARPNNEDYLLKTLASINMQLPVDSDSLLYHQILIAIVHVQPSPSATSFGIGTSHHIRYEEAKKIYKDNPYFIFLELSASEIYSDPKQGATATNDLGNANHPGYRVRKQSRNLAAVVKKVASLGRYYLFLEDDMEFCPYVIHAIEYLIDKSSRYHPNWLAVRASYGMNGILMRQSDVLVFAEYLLKHQERRPPDHLVVEWYAGETDEAKRHRQQRANIGFKYNLFNHIGQVSTLRSAKQTSFPLCYDLLLEPTVFQVEAYSPKDCPKDDIWPCNVPRPEPTFIHWDQVALSHHR